MLTVGGQSDAFHEALRSYCYRSPRLSALEVLYLDAFWEFLAARVYPQWLAPNLITLLGGLCDLAAFALTVAHSPNLRGEAPRWVYAGSAALLLTYQSLDGSDGKQARRTRSGSALGELMDHGLDACVIGLITAFTVDAMGFGWSSAELWLTILGAQWAFMLTNMTLLLTGCMEIGLIDVMELQTSMAGGRHPIARLPRRRRAHRAAPPIASRAVGIAASLFRNALSVRHARREAGDRDVRLGQQFFSLVVYSALVLLCFVRVREKHGMAGNQSMLLLLLCCNFCFGEMVARMLMLRLGRVRLPVVPYSVLCLCVFVAAVEVGPIAQLLTVGLAGISFFAFFTSSVLAIARALQIHPFRVRGAVHWYTLRGAKQF
ncbi:hypothetical protein AB1Y20_018103 [Prymnesium parvum]|uniref:CDP-alcohol phosphatidyltransferase n=1 Tax=Prymnesium parvum TaxID=97485 RepID=A0AB34JQZ4_PRYPA